MTCGCNDKCELPKALQINNPGEVTLFHRVDIPASQGDDTTYPPKNGLYRNVLLVYLANNHSYLYNSDGIPTRVDGPAGPGTAAGGETGQVLAKRSDADYDTTWVTQTSANDAKLTLTRNNTEIGDFTANASVDKTIDIEVPTKTSDLTNDGATGESTYAEATDIADIWEEIEEIEAASDVTDVVGTYAELEAYDTSKLKDNDIIKVLEDETQDDQITYYRWDTDTETFTLIGAIGPYYTKSEADTTFQGKLTAGSNITIDANNEISATDTTYSDFTGATSSVAGAHGLVPAPTTSDPDKFLKGDGTWGTPPGTTYAEGTGIDITGNTIAVDTTQVSMKSEYAVKKSYTIDLTAQSTSNFYPVIFPRTNNMIDCEIHSEGGGSAEPYNQNIIHFNVISEGWSDNYVTKKLIILQEGNYSNSEITIGCIGLGHQDGYNCVWLRGGIKYYFTSNYIAEAHTSDYQINNEKFTVGPNYYGGTNANVDIVRTPLNTSKDVALIEDVDARANLYRYTKSQYNSSGNSWYYPIANLPIDNSGNSASVIINGRFGGWTNANMAKIDLLLTNRSNYSGDNVTASGSIKGPYTGALAICNVVVYKQTDKSAIVYLKCDGYFAFDITADYYQATKSWTGNYTTTPSGTLIWSTATTDALEKVDQNGVIYGVLADTAGSVKTTNIDALAVTTAKIADGAITEAKINATDWAKKVNVASIDLTGQTTTLLSLTKTLGTNGINYARWISRTDGGSSNISDKPTGGTNKSFVCEAIASRWATNSDYGYQLICRSGSDTNPYVAYIDQNSASITWSRLRPTVNDATLTITQGGSTLGTFTANASSNVTIDVPGGGSGEKGDPGKGCPIGTILPYSGSTLPEGYLACNGSAVSRTTYADLFDVIGTTYGAGDGSTTFNLPNLKGKVAVGQDTGDTDFDTLGETGGEKAHTLTIDEIPSHRHPYQQTWPATTTEHQDLNMFNVRNKTSNAVTPLSNLTTAIEVTGGNQNDGAVMGATQAYQGGGQAHNNLQPYIVIQYIIKFKDLAATVAEVVNQHTSSSTDVYSADYVNDIADNVAYIDDPTASETPTPWVETSMIENDAVTPDKIDFSAMYISAPDGTSNITVGSSGAIIQTLALPVGKWRVFSQFRLSAGGIGANATRLFYTGFKYGDTMSATTINEIPMNISGDTGGSGRALVSMTSKEINVTVAPYTISSYVTKGDIPGSDVMVYANPGIYMYALRVG